MRIAVKLFAIIRDRAGVSELELELPDGAKVDVAAAWIAQRHPVVRELLLRCAFAVNREYAARSTPLKDGDELAVIPPVSGGSR